jgi:RalA-binding protein 1
MSPVSENTTRKNISGPLNGTPIPPGYNFGGGKDTQQAELASTNERERDRDRKTKSSHFWPFGSGAGDSKSGSHAKNGSGTVMPRAVFGVPITEALQVSQIANLPSVVFRCILYLETKHAEWEEGIYRLSGSSAVIKALKDRFNTGQYTL